MKQKMNYQAVSHILLFWVSKNGLFWIYIGNKAIMSQLECCQTELDFWNFYTYLFLLCFKFLN
jgi:hypothetical protein